MTSLNDIRSKFIDHFVKEGHQHVDSSPLVPRNDPSLMFTNSGMVQFKNTFIGQETRDYNRAVTAQKCVRAGGKHNDLDNVGYTARHHTFFEMLGNFSFGDYFKEDAIPFAWELLTKGFGLPAEKLLVTVYHTDDEAAEIWKKVAGFSDDKIIRIATDDNFWSMGPTGPCGPCSEIFYDHGDHIWGGPPGSPEEDGDRFIEIWNLVFMQNERFEDGSQTDLPKPSIDTGMGIERVGAILQGQHDNYDTDIFRALIEASANATGVDAQGDQNVHHRVIADHLRSTSFLIADGVMPSNEGRGYVLRRIMRRAMRHAHLLGAQDPIMHKLVPTLVAQMGQFYTELGRAQATIEETLLLEETRFKTTLDRGLRLLDDETSKLADGQALAGDVAFKLYDTFGFPLDLTQDALRAQGREVDVAGFEEAMSAQKAMARAAWSGSGEKADAPIWFDLAEEFGSTEFLGYVEETGEAHVLALVKEGTALDQASGEISIVLNQTPFYAESGGQVGDQGWIRFDGGEGEITDTQSREGVFVHQAKITKGEIKKGDAVQLEVDHSRRSKIRANHSATHLLNEALRETLGEHVAQRGSLNAPDRLRFDFSHNKAMSADELRKVEEEVNSYIRQNSQVSTRIMTPDAARELGAQALFGEKYGDEVRVVSMGKKANSGKGQDKETYSLELCGGTHVGRLGEIGLFVLLSDSASSAGVRRVEALTGQAAIDYVGQRNQVVAELANRLKAKPEELIDRVTSLQNEKRDLANEVAELKRRLAAGGGTGPAGNEAEAIGDLKFIHKRMDGISGKDLPPLMDEIKQSAEDAVIVLFAVDQGRVAAAVGTTGNNAPSAKDLIPLVTEKIGGKGGGGRPDMAQGGGDNADGIDAAIDAIRQTLASR